jgi:small GTP-binding protein
MSDYIVTGDYIVIVGTISSGKSTFLNAIIQNNYFKMGDGLTTLRQEDYKLDHMRLIDIPGLNEASKNNLEDYMPIIQNALAVFHIVDAAQVSSIATSVILDNVYSWRANHDDPKIYHVLNKTDSIDNLELVLEEFAKKFLKYKTITPEIIPISAKSALASIVFNKNYDDATQEKFIIKTVWGNKKEKTRDDITEQDLNEIYKDSNFDSIKTIIEDIYILSIYKHAIDRQNTVPCSALERAVNDYNHDSTEKKGSHIVARASIGMGYILRIIPSLRSVSEYLIINGFKLLGYKFTQYFPAKIAQSNVFLEQYEGDFKGAYDIKHKMKMKKFTPDDITTINMYISGDYKEHLYYFRDKFNMGYKNSSPCKDYTFVRIDGKYYMIKGVFVRNRIIKIDQIVYLYVEGNKVVKPKAAKSSDATNGRVKEKVD